MRTHTRWACALLAPALALACKPPPPSPPVTPQPSTATPGQLTGAGLEPLPAALGDPAELTQAKVTLGRQLFFDKRLSVNGTQSCNSCHALGNFGVDNAPTSTGAAGSRGTRNSPTVMNAAGHFAQFWDARAPDVEAQAKGPILNPVEMGMKDEAAVVDVLRAIPGYQRAFRAAFPGEADPITFDNYAKAVGAFERKLVTPAPIDAFLRGDERALDAQQKKGAALFIQAGCTSCHGGAFMGGAMMQKLGVSEAWPRQQDVGREQVTREPKDRMFFKVPSLRNVEKTGPYFHDGSVPTLDDAVRMMARHQLGTTLSDDQTASIVAFLRATTGSAPADLVSEPPALQ